MVELSVGVQRIVGGRRRHNRRCDAGDVGVDEADQLFKLSDLEFCAAGNMLNPPTQLPSVLGEAIVDNNAQQEGFDSAIAHDVPPLLADAGSVGLRAYQPVTGYDVIIGVVL
jgi:hypothetical protein